MRKCLTYTAAAFLLIGCAHHAGKDAVQPDSIQHLGKVYRKLTGAELSQAITGVTLSAIDVVVSGDNNFYYDADGKTYWSTGHRGVPLIGTYQVANDMVCHTTSHSFWCFDIYKSRDGDFLTISTTLGQPNRVILSLGTRPYPWRSR
jgi:hypothetical protein